MQPEIVNRMPDDAPFIRQRDIHEVPLEHQQDRPSGNQQSYPKSQLLEGIIDRFEHRESFQEFGPESQTIKTGTILQAPFRRVRILSYRRIVIAVKRGKMNTATKS